MGGGSDMLILPGHFPMAPISLDGFPFLTRYSATLNAQYTIIDSKRPSMAERPVALPPF